MGAMSAFGGASRRLEILQESPVTVVDDYAHHPTEVIASLTALQGHFKKPGLIRKKSRRLIVVFQPHLYSRTRDHLEAFAKALTLADVVVLTDIYPAREKPIPYAQAVDMSFVKKAQAKFK